mmetsp:Transcript_88666/g.253386  ORF Transcript_88666/g.253386 Transcript_88666/m.253386 type:complete len:425 (+) Transcript_88666:531-1805(+)
MEARREAARVLGALAVLLRLEGQLVQPKDLGGRRLVELGGKVAECDRHVIDVGRTVEPNRRHGELGDGGSVGELSLLHGGLDLLVLNRRRVLGAVEQAQELGGERGLGLGRQRRDLRGVELGDGTVEVHHQLLPPRLAPRALTAPLGCRIERVDDLPAKLARRVAEAAHARAAVDGAAPAADGAGGGGAEFGVGRVDGVSGLEVRGARRVRRVARLDIRPQGLGVAHGALGARRGERQQRVLERRDRRRVRLGLVARVGEVVEAHVHRRLDTAARAWDRLPNGRHLGHEHGLVVTVARAVVVVHREDEDRLLVRLGALRQQGAQGRLVRRDRSSHVRVPDVHEHHVGEGRVQGHQAVRGTARARVGIDHYDARRGRSHREGTPGLLGGLHAEALVEPGVEDGVEQAALAAAGRAERRHHAERSL